MKKNMNNNQYLCKAKRTFNGDWTTGCLLVFDDEYRIATSCLQSTFEDEPDAVLEVCTYKVDPSTICRCVGIEDKNGRLIWENDIVNCFEAECCGKISWNESEAGFYFDVLLEDGTYEEEHIYDYADCMMVIGNIFDNPELLEK